MKAFLFFLAATSSQAFVPSRTSPLRPSTERSALWHRWVPRSEEPSLWKDDDRLRQHNNRYEDQYRHIGSPKTDGLEERDALSNFFLASLFACLCVMGTSSTSAHAVSGGGLDFAGLDISGQDYSSKNYKGKDFTQVIAKGTNFAKSNLQGCRFYKSYLVNADFTGSDISGASLEDTSMDGASLKDVVAKGSYFSKSILDTATVENADFSDAQFPPKVTPLLCDRADLKGTNPTTGADTRESAMCL
jgi:uncharacterized protein YjbI with pentapeptide repeats